MNRGLPEPFSRRSFLRGSAAAAAPLVLGGARPLPRPEDPDVLRVGLVGCGGRGTGAAYQAACAEEGTTVLWALADVFPERIESSLATLAESLGPERAGRVQVAPERRFSGFDAYRELIASDVDVVLLATPPHFRPEHLEAAVEAEKHVFCEKPAAVDAPGVRRVLATVRRARERSLSLVSGFCWRYNVRHRELFERVLGGAIGDVRAVYTTYNASPLATHPRQDGWSDMEWQLKNWQHVLWLSGDHVVEQACHSLDKMSWALGEAEPLQVSAVGGRQAREGLETGNVYDHFGVAFEYPGGVKGFHMCRQIAGCPFDNRDFLLGTQGTATVDGWVPLHTIEGEEPWEYEGEGNDMYQAELDALVRSIRAGAAHNDGEWMARSTLLGVMARMAAYTGESVTWEQALASEDRLGPEAYRFGWVGMRPVAIPGQTRLR